MGTLNGSWAPETAATLPRGRWRGATDVPPLPEISGNKLGSQHDQDAQ